MIFLGHESRKSQMVKKMECLFSQSLYLQMTNQGWVLVDLRNLILHMQNDEFGVDKHHF